MPPSSKCFFSLEHFSHPCEPRRKSFDSFPSKPGSPARLLLAHWGGKRAALHHPRRLYIYARYALIALFFLLASEYQLCGQKVVLAKLPETSDSAAVLPDDPSAFADPQMSAVSKSASTQPTSQSGQQTSRILGIIPNFRSVSADVKLPPQSPKEKFVLTMQDSFDYSSFLFVGILAGVSQAENSYPEFHQGAAGYARYYWHSFADNVGGNFMTEFAVPTLTREDPRYYTKGSGGLIKRTGYSISRLLITRTDDGNPTANLSEVIGNGAAAGISDLYYPGRERTWTKTGQKWIVQIGIDGFSNLVKEFWPDVNDHVFHTH
jgi:hypothetical protein